MTLWEHYANDNKKACKHHINHVYFFSQPIYFKVNSWSQKIVIKFETCTQKNGKGLVPTQKQKLNYLVAHLKSKPKGFGYLSFSGTFICWTCYLPLWTMSEIKEVFLQDGFSKLERLDIFMDKFNR